MSIFKYKDKKIFYQIDGNVVSDKPVMIILNGIMMSTKSWDIFTKAFTENNTLIRYDMLDQGQSSKMDDNYTQSIQVELLKALMDHLQLEKAHIVGISYGASIALQFSIKYPSYVDKMVIANVVAYTSPWLKAIGDGWNQVGRTRDGESYYNITIPYIYSPQFYIKNIEWMENRKKLLIPVFSDPQFLDAMERLTKSAETHDVREQLHSIKIDTLIISSEEDYLTPMFEQNYIKERMSNSKLVLLKECGHASMYEVPTQFAELVLGHINNKHTVTL